MPSQWSESLTQLSALIASLQANGTKLLANDVSFPTIVALQGDVDVTTGMAVGTIVRILEQDGFNLRCVGSDAVTFDYASGSGMRFVVDMVVARPSYFGAVGGDDGVSGPDDRAAIDRAMASGAQLLDLAGGQFYYGAPAFSATIPVVNGMVRSTAALHDYALSSDDLVEALDQLSAAPIPSQSGLGYWRPYFADNNQVGRAPPGGTWAYFHLGFSTGLFFSVRAGVVAGNAVITDAVGQQAGLVWRVR